MWRTFNLFAHFQQPFCFSSVNPSFPDIIHFLTHCLFDLLLKFLHSGFHTHRTKMSLDLPVDKQKGLFFFLFLILFLFNLIYLSYCWIPPAPRGFFSPLVCGILLDCFYLISGFSLLVFFSPFPLKIIPMSYFYSLLFYIPIYLLCFLYIFEWLPVFPPCVISPFVEFSTGTCITWYLKTKLITLLTQPPFSFQMGIMALTALP